MAQPRLDIPSPFYRVSLKAVIFDKKQRLLVVQAADGSWEMPGGGWEHGETMQHCLRREVMEELGVGIEHIDFTKIFPYTGESRRGYQNLKLAMPVQLASEDFEYGVDIQTARHVTPQELATLDMRDGESGIKTHTERVWRLS